MDKLAPVAYPVHDPLRRRWSPRAFSDQSVEPEKLLSLFEAARWAASSFNEQPWYFIVTRKEEPSEFGKMLSCLVENNVTWAKNAPVLMLSVAQLNFAKNGKPNRHAFHDVGMAVANLIIQATTMGLFVHQMAGFSVDKARDLYGIPEGYEPVAAIALGYPGSPDSLSEPLKQRELAPRERKSQDEFVFSGVWGRKTTLNP